VVGIGGGLGNATAKAVSGPAQLVHKTCVLKRDSSGVLPCLPRVPHSASGKRLETNCRYTLLSTGDPLIPSGLDGEHHDRFLREELGVLRIIPPLRGRPRNNGGGPKTGFFRSLVYRKGFMDSAGSWRVTFR